MHGKDINKVSWSPYIFSDKITNLMIKYNSMKEKHYKYY